MDGSHVGMNLCVVGVIMVYTCVLWGLWYTPVCCGGYHGIHLCVVGVIMGISADLEVPRVILRSVQIR